METKINWKILIIRNGLQQPIRLQNSKYFKFQKKINNKSKKEAKKVKSQRQKKTKKEKPKNCQRKMQQK